MRVRSVGAEGAIYYKATNSAQSYRQLLDVDALRIVREAFSELYNMTPADKMKAAIATLKAGVNNEVDSINNDLVQVSADLYWDMRDAKLTSMPTEACMRELLTRVAPMS